MAGSEIAAGSVFQLLKLFIKKGARQVSRSVGSKRRLPTGIVEYTTTSPLGVCVLTAWGVVRAHPFGLPRMLRHEDAPFDDVV